MNFLFLSPHFPLHYYLFCQKLHEAGVKVLGIGEASPDSLPRHLADSLTDYYHVTNMEDYDQVVRAVGYFIHRHGRMDRVESHNEHWLHMESDLRQDFNIPGMLPPEMAKVKRKSVMKEVFRSVGAPVARGEKFSSSEQAWAFAGSVGYPIFAKPDIGVGANATFKIHNQHDLHAFLVQKPHDDYIMEEFIDGHLATFDGLTDRDGRIVFAISHFSGTGVFEVVQENSDLSFYSLRDIPPDILDLGTKSIHGFGIREKFFHLEFLRRHDNGSLIAMEINMRPPGGFTTDLMNFSCDIDVYREWTNIVLGKPIVEGISHKYHSAHIARKSGKSYRHSHEEILKRFSGKIMMFSEVSEIFSPVMGNFVYIGRSPDLSEIHEMIEFIQAKNG
jgi:hypothetical protein